jgi:hypothetical protein
MGEERSALEIILVGVVATDEDQLERPRPVRLISILGADPLAFIDEDAAGVIPLPQVALKTPLSLGTQVYQDGMDSDGGGLFSNPDPLCVRGGTVRIFL